MQDELGPGRDRVALQVLDDVVDRTDRAACIGALLVISATSPRVSVHNAMDTGVSTPDELYAMFTVSPSLTMGGTSAANAIDGVLVLLLSMATFIGGVTMRPSPTNDSVYCKSMLREGAYYCHARMRRESAGTEIEVKWPKAVWPLALGYPKRSAHPENV